MKNIETKMDERQVDTWLVILVHHARSMMMESTTATEIALAGHNIWHKHNTGIHLANGRILSTTCISGQTYLDRYCDEKQRDLC